MPSSRRIRGLAPRSDRPSANQALDEALLRSREEPTLRFYTWDPPGLSLGYFQPVADFADRSSFPPHHLVRRTTGGKAIFHDRGELTFSFTFPASWLPVSTPESYDLVHGWMREAGRLCGILLENRGKRAPLLSDVPGSPWCFHDSTERCQVLAGRKVIGTAQRRVEGWVLHHGSILFEEARATPGTGGLRDVREDLSFEELQEAIVEAFAKGLDARVVPGEFSSAELALARELAGERYENAAFTNRR